MFASSNDLLADRRFAWAMALLSEGDAEAAADLLEQVVEIVPDWAPGWGTLGDARDRLGARDAAVEAWRRAATLDPDGRLGASLKLARHAVGTPAKLQEAYVRALFDDYAPRFDRHLVESLGYRGPELLAAAIEAALPGRLFERALDLGCGTGLMGRALLGRARRIDGVDLSPAMVAQARRTGAYDALTVGPLTDALATGPGGYDLVTAADVLVYCGDLAPVMRGVAHVLSAGGLLAFTVQAGDGAADFFLGEDLRFAHSRRHVEAAVRDAGLVMLRLDEASTRAEKGTLVPGLLALARRG